MADTEEPILACPDCDGPGVYPRTTKIPTYRCRDCGATFAEPVERSTPRQRASVSACPECDEPSIYRRRTKSPAYRCRDCGATFAEPTERPGHPPASGTAAATRTAAIRRAAATLGEPLSVTAYDDWQRDHEDAPSGL
jgi:hypothetical protein